MNTKTNRKFARKSKKDVRRSEVKEKRREKRLKRKKAKAYRAEKQGTASVRFLYRTLPGRVCLMALTRPTVSKTAGAFLSSPLSTPFINGFVKKNGIDMSQFEQKKYKSYNDFFTRRIIPDKRPVDEDPNHFISPCDGRLSAYVIDDDSLFYIKESYYTPSELLKDPILAEKYRGGYALIFRLCVDDYHRYCYIDSGHQEKNIFIKGVLHTVRPQAFDKVRVFKRNSREYTLLHTDNFGDVVQMEVGAMMVGRIVNHHSDYDFLRGEEKGYFEFGGSTIILFVEKGKLKLYGNVIEDTIKDIETRVQYGQCIGEKL